MSEKWEGWVVAKGLLVAGTTSDAGKSLVTAGLCRWLARRGVSVAPFKAQNMSNNSMVCADGAEIGRAQWVQAVACRATPEAAMNPVLLKPGSDLRSHVVLMGHPWGELRAGEWATGRKVLAKTAFEAFRDLSSRFDVVIAEGAGSPAEINLRDRDLANMGLARPLRLPTVVVGDIDRGGLFAAMVGTLAVLSPGDQALIAGFVINKFRGDLRVLAPGIDQLATMTGRPTFGVLPWLPGLWVDVEDSLDLESRPGEALPALGEQTLRVAVVRLPRLSNVTDIDALACEPGVVVRLVTRPAEITDADLVVLPGSRATVSDLGWLRANGLADAIVARAGNGGHTLGICGGYQMLAHTITDEVESGVGTVPGLHLLPTTVTFAGEKTLGRPHGHALGADVAGYEIHHGIVSVAGGSPFLDGCRDGPVWGTAWHGIFENDGFRRALLDVVARAAGRRFVPAPDTSFAGLRERRLDALGDLVEQHLDTTAVLRLIEHGAPADLPTLSATLG